MSQWIDDFSACSLDDVIKSQNENRAWSKELRTRTSTLVNNRLANAISQADYATDRKLTQEDALECRRRATILDDQISRRTLHAPRIREL